jgi:hypothetical protein
LFHPKISIRKWEAFLEGAVRAERHNIIQTLILEEIRAIVAEAIQGGGCLSTAECASHITRAYPNCGVEEREIADQILITAAKAGVAVEFGKARGA